MIRKTLLDLILFISVIVLLIMFARKITTNSRIIESKPNNYLELQFLYKNYLIVEKKCYNETHYYLFLKNPVDSTKKDIPVKVKDYIYFNWYVGDYIK